MIQIKTPDEIEKIAEAGSLSKEILSKGLLKCKPGITTLEINSYIEGLLEENNVVSWFKEVNNYPYATCIAVNEVWVHGMPNKKALKKGDIVSVDLGVKKDGYYVDHCWTIPVEENVENKDIFNYTKHSNPEVENFLEAGINSLNTAIAEFKVGNRSGDISYVMQKAIEDKGYSVIREYTGHGVGLSNHEEPHIHCYGSKGAGPELKVGMVFAIEVMYSMGSPDIALDDDEWSVITADSSLTGMFEHTVALTEDGLRILTK